MSEATKERNELNQPAGSVFETIDIISGDRVAWNPYTVPRSDFWQFGTAGETTEKELLEVVWDAGYTSYENIGVVRLFKFHAPNDKIQP